MYKVIGCIVLYNNQMSEILNLIQEFYKENINQKLVIVDNSEQPQLRDKILKVNKNIEYIHSKNRGYGAANNIVIKKYSGQADYYLVMNPDIFIKIEDLKELISFADKIGEFGVIMPKVLYPDASNQYLCKMLPTPMNLIARRFLVKFKNLVKKLDYNFEYRFSNYDKIMEVPYLSGCFMFCNYRNLSRENGFDERYFIYLEDVDLSRRLYKYVNYFYPNVEIIHGFGKASFKNIKMTLVHIKSAIRYFNKWGWFFDSERKYVNNEILTKYKKGRS